MTMTLDPSDEQVVSRIRTLISDCGELEDSFEADLILQQIQTSLKLLTEGHNTGQLKLITRALKELRYAYRIFNEYPHTKRISIFGSARTPEDHPDYIAAHTFSEKLAENDWICITGAANGIMKAGMAGNVSEGHFGLSIRLPFEVPTNKYIEGDPKLIHFKYFFTRKLMFMSHSNAIGVFPGGVGTMDELFEMLTLIQTGKGSVIPIVLMEGPGGVYWQHWETYVRKNLLENGWISAEDMSLFYIAPTIEDGVAHVLQFYRNYHSSRYVKDHFVMRLNQELSSSELKSLNRDFGQLLESGEFYQSEMLPEERGEYPELPRLCFHHTRKDFGLVRELIDAVNRFGSA